MRILGKKLFLYVAEKKHRVIIAVAIITLLGAWLRLYHFGDWLHFELDQARDVIFVSEAVTNGLGQLPLLGPKASGTSLQLGPAYYYMAYVSALIFGNTPEGHAFFVAILSILSIPIFFVLIRRMFVPWISVGLTLLYSVSAFFVLYARFGWNPNALPFFLLLGFLALLKATDKISCHPGRWFVLASACFAITTQLHFISFVAVPLTTIAYLIYTRPKFSIKAWTLAVGCIFIVYIPLITSEVFSHAANTKAFFSAVQEKKSDRHILTAFSTAVISEAEASMLLLAGWDDITLPKYSFKGGLEIKRSCGSHCRKTSNVQRFFIQGFLLIGTGLLLWFLRRNTRTNEMVLFSLWSGVLIILYTVLSNSMPPRFFLLFLPLPFLFIGLFAKILSKRFHIFTIGVFCVCIGIFAWENAKVLSERFHEMRIASTDRIETSADHILEEPVRTTIEQQRHIAEFMVEKYHENGFPIFIHGESFWRRSLKYLCESMDAPVGHLDPQAVFLESNNFIILRSDKEGNSLLKSYRERYNVVSRDTFGTLTILTLRPKPDMITGEKAVIIQMSELLSGAAGDRVASKKAADILPLSESVDAGDIERKTWDDILLPRDENL